MIYYPGNLSDLPQNPGVYIYRNREKEIIYIGKAINIKNRVSSYFRKNTDNEKAKKIAQACETIEIIEVGSEFEALILEAKLINLNKPRFNVIWRDDKSYIYIGITKDQYPLILLQRKKEAASSSILFGPCPSSKEARELISFLRVIFPFCTQRPPYRRVCFYRHLGLCKPCPSEIEKSPPAQKVILREVYINNIRQIAKLLSGKSKSVLKDLDKEMKKYSADLRFEKAQAIRDRINKIANLISISRFKPEIFIDNPQYSQIKWKEEENNLKEVLRLYFQINKSGLSIECYDISNISGKHATGSMITFQFGSPDKSRYRHFRIKKLTTPNDFEMLKEVFQRRLNHNEWRLPDIIVVDGGSLQLSVLLKVLEFFKLNTPAISLAKKREEIYIHDKGEFKILRLPLNSPALNLLRRLRDEAHRFALAYHQKLRIKYLLGSVKK